MHAFGKTIGQVYSDNAVLVLLGICVTLLTQGTRPENQNSSIAQVHKAKGFWFPRTQNPNDKLRL